MIRNKVLISSCTLAFALVLAGCETVGDAVGTGLRATMSGAEGPSRGDPDGTGTAQVTIVDRTDNLCYTLNVRDIEPANVAHIHRGGPGTSGPPVVTFDPPADGESHGCLSIASALADEIAANPGGFYVNIHNGPYPTGAIRGQLRR